MLVQEMIVFGKQKRGQPSLSRLPLKMELKKAQCPYIGHRAVKRLDYLYIKWSILSLLINRPALRLEARLPLYQTQLFCALVQPSQGFNLIARNPLALSNGEDWSCAR